MGFKFADLHKLFPFAVQEVQNGLEEVRQWVLVFADLHKLFQFAEQTQSTPWKVLSADSKNERDRDEAKKRDAYESLRKQCELWSKSMGKKPRRSGLSLVASGIINHVKLGSNFDSGFQKDLFISGRRLARTKDGRLVNAPGDSKVGDCLCLLKGGRVPYVLREENDNYKLVGDCYVEEAMYGGLWDESRCSRIRLS